VGGRSVTLQHVGRLPEALRGLKRAGIPQIVLEPDGWTIRTADLAPSAHEEHTVMVSKGGPVVLTAA
jgi:methionyl aminopeptidase